MARQFDRAILGALVAAALLPLAAAASDAAPSAAEIAALVEQLGAPSYSQREQATRLLAEIGVPAKDALLAALSSPDAEVRRRAQRILGLVLERDFQVRLREFQADADPAADHGLPCWNEFRRQLGDDPAARRLFVAAQRAEQGLLEAARGDGKLASAALDARLAQIREESDGDDAVAQRNAPLGRVATMLLVGARPDVVLSDDAAYGIASLIAQRAFGESLSAGPFAAPLKKLLGAWVLRDFSDRPQLGYQNLMLGLRWNLPETLPLAIGLLSNQQVEPYFRPYPILAVARFGNREHAPHLEPLLADETVCQQVENEGRAVQCQVRDVALVALLHLTGQPPQDYGFPRFEPALELGYDPERLGFADDAARQAALDRWRHWRADNP